MPVPVLSPRRGYVKLIKEAARGTPLATTISLPVSTRSLQGKFNRITPDYLNNSVHIQREVGKGRQEATGDISGPILVDSFGHLLMAVFGTDTISGAGPYTHTFSVAPTTPTYTIEKNLGGLTAASQSQQYSNMVLQRLTITGRVEQDQAFLEYASTWIGKAPTLITPTTWTQPTEFVIPAALTAFNYGASTPLADYLAEYQVVFEREAAAVKGANNSLDISDAVATGFRGSGYVDLYFQDWSKYTDFVNNTEQNINVVTALSASKSLQLSFTKAHMVDENPEEGQQFIKQRFPIQGVYDSTAGVVGAAQAILTNSQAVAY